MQMSMRKAFSGQQVAAKPVQVRSAGPCSGFFRRAWQQEGGLTLCETSGM